MTRDHSTYFDDDLFMAEYRMGSNPEREFEVGWYYSGLPTSEEKVQALRELLDTVGDSMEDWLLAPQIRVDKAGSSVSDFGNGPIVIREDHWAVYGVATRMPKYGHVIEGVSLPSYTNVIKS